MQNPQDWADCKHLLCIRLDNLGDVLMTTPAFRALKGNGPRRITLLTSRVGAAIARYIPEIDEVLEFLPPWEKNGATGGQSQALAIVEVLRQRQFDGAIIFTVYSQNPLPAAMLCYLAGIPRVAGYCRENPYRLLTDWRPDREPLYQIRHEVIRQLELVEGLGFATLDDSFSLRVPASAPEKALRKLQGAGVRPEKPWLLMHPGVSEAKRQYPASDFGVAARGLAQELGYQVVLTGVTSEQLLADVIREVAGEGIYSLMGELDMEELVALIGLAPVLIANNTGPVHIAAALGVPVVVLYALTNPQHTPWKVPHRVLPFDVPPDMRSKNVIIGYAYERAFVKRPSKVEPAAIVDAVKELLGEKIPVAETEVLKL